MAALPQRAGAVLAGLPEHERGVTLRTGSPGIADASELWIEVVLGHSTSLDLAMLARRDMANAVEFKTVSNSASDLEREFLPLTV